jgi:hypothetical protein
VAFLFPATRESSLKRLDKAEGLSISQMQEGHIELGTEGFHLKIPSASGMATVSGLLTVRSSLDGEGKACWNA